jgi:hypothetical protein
MMISNVKGQFAKVTGTSTLLEAGADLRTIRCCWGFGIWRKERSIRISAELLPLCFRLLQPSDELPAGAVAQTALSTGSLWNRPLCGGIMQVVERLSALRLIPASAQHESTSPASLLPRASARTLALCLIGPSRPYPSSF